MRTARRLRARALAWSLAALALCLPCAAQERARTLEELRADFAMRFLEPDAHMALAKHFRDSGNRLQAFYTLEAARRYRFEREEFDEAFDAAFRRAAPHDHSPAAEAKLLEEHARRPDALDLIEELVDIYSFRKDWTKAKAFIAKAVALRPDDFEYTRLMARALEEEDKDQEAERVVREYVARYPETVAGYQIRIEEVIEKDPAAAKSLLTEAARKFPREGVFVFGLGTLLQSEGKLREAEEHFARAARLAPDSVHIQSWVGRFFYKVRKDNRRALDYYLDAYLLDPHAYESEYVESRIPKINGELAEAEYERQVKAGVPLAKALEDPNPAVVYRALEQVRERWKPAHLKLLPALMGHDDTAVRWHAMLLIREKADRSFDPTLRALLADADPRRRGLAAYIAARLWKRESFPALRAMLREESQLLRFDAVSALVMEGGAEGRQIVAENLKAETHPRLRKLMERALKEPEAERP
jgi:tetratricopeptide (TPR) repeat protein